MQLHPTNKTTKEGRRRFLRQTGQLLIGFSLLPAPMTMAKENAKGCLGDRPLEDNINTWLRLDAAGNLTVLTGKTELGQGIKTALMQIAAEELDMPMDRVRIVTADTAQTADERYTSGSASVTSSGSAIRSAAAEARRILLGMAAAHLNSAADELVVKDGIVTALSTKQSVSYAALLKGKSIEGSITGKAPQKDPSKYAIVGTAWPREDIRSMVTGQPVYVQDLRMPGMLHARILRPPVYGAKLSALPTDHIPGVTGLMKVFRNGSFVGIVTTEEYQAVKALKYLREKAVWEKPVLRPAQAGLYGTITSQSLKAEEVEKNEAVPALLRGSITTVEAEYRRPYQMHGSIGPSCAIALWQRDELTVWSHTQGAFPLRATLADLLRLPESKIRVIATPGSGCYGHNGADDAGADAALLAMELPGKPVRVQWMREDEHSWEPYGSAMVVRLTGGLNEAGDLLAIDTTIWSDSHIERPGGKAGHFIAGRDLATPFTFTTSGYLGASYRNALPLYDTQRRVTLYSFKGPLRTSALRSLGAYANIFALESFMDELASKAGKDPAAFRLQYLKDDRAKAVVQKVVEITQWNNKVGVKDGKTGWGIAFAQYKNDAAYFAVVAEVEINKTSKQYRLKSLTGVIDAGQVINIDGLKNQTEGGMIQASSWTMLEEVRYSEQGITSRGWDSYPIMRFLAVPAIKVEVINRPGQPPMGAGEAAQGPTAAAIANAIYHATGSRLRELPLKPAKINWQY